MRVGSFWRSGSLAGLVVVGLAVTAPVAAQQSQRPLAPGHWTYSYTELLQALGCGDAWTGFSEPLVASSVLERLAEADCTEPAGEDEPRVPFNGVWLSALEAELGLRPDGQSGALIGGVLLGGEDGPARFELHEGALAAARLEWRVAQPVSLWIEHCDGLQ